jgi:hypothetical protein
MSGTNPTFNIMSIVMGTVLAIFLPFLGWLAITIIDMSGRLARIESTIPMVYQSREESLRLRDTRIDAVTERIGRLERLREKQE